MKKIAYIFILLIGAVVFSCEEPIGPEPNFKEINKLTIYDYLKANEEDFSIFISILETGGILETLRAYNPDGNGYTLFAPDNNAIERFISESLQFSSVNELLNDPEFVASFSRFHVVSSEYRSNEFPFGAFAEPTLSGDYLIVSFNNESDSAYYKINNQATITKSNIETSNGFVHLIETALQPITQTSYQKLSQNPDLSIFKAAVDLTGLQSSIDFDLKQGENLLPVTLFVEPDSIYLKKGINSIEDLISLVSPNNTEFTSSSNGLYNYVAYHFLEGSYFIDDFVDKISNYNTMSDIPLRINGAGLDVAINQGKVVFDTIVVQGDTTLVNYIKIMYDESNDVSQSGAIHFIDQIMKQQSPSVAIANFEFYEEPLLKTYYQKKGNFLIENSGLLNRINWTGADDLIYYAGEDNTSNASNFDFLFIDGDFTISYTIPRIVQGKYKVILRAESWNSENAVVEVLVDRKKVGQLVDLSTGSTPANPFDNIYIGDVDFGTYEEHVVEIRSLLPGRFLWDYIRFEPF